MCAIVVIVTMTLVVRSTYSRGHHALYFYPNRPAQFGAPHLTLSLPPLSAASATTKPASDVPSSSPASPMFTTSAAPPRLLASLFDCFAGCAAPATFTPSSTPVGGSFIATTITSARKADWKRGRFAGRRRPARRTVSGTMSRNIWARGKSKMPAVRRRAERRVTPRPRLWRKCWFADTEGIGRSQDHCSGLLPAALLLCRRLRGRLAAVPCRGRRCLPNADCGGRHRCRLLPLAT